MAAEQVVEQVTEQVADHFEEAAAVTRAINAKSTGLVLSGVGIGIAIGFVIGYRWNRAKIRAEAFRDSEEEVEKIREMYRDSARVIDRHKPTIDEVIETRKYSTVEEVEEEPERPTRPPVPAGPPQRRIFEEPTPTIKLETGKSKNVGWEYSEELASRSKDHPYIIHQDEYIENSTEYQQAVLTWYAGDEVLTDEDESPIENADEVVDLNHMSKFGHGTDDFNVVFVRNDSIRMEYEICRSPNSYEDEVNQGLSNDESH